MKTIKYFSTMLAFFALMVLLHSCGDIKTSSYFTPPKSKLDQYEALEIYDFESAIPDFPKDSLTKIPDEVEKLLENRNNMFKEVKHGGIDDIPADKTLVLLGEIAQYVPSSEVRFEGGALKFGEISLSLRLAFVEKNTGREVTTGEISTFSSLGIFRSGHIGKDMNQIIADEIVKYISENY